MLEQLIAQFVSLAGVAALVAAIVNVAKTFGLPDGHAQNVSAVLSLVAFVALVLTKIFAPSVDFALLDEQAADFAVLVLYLLGFFVQMGLPAQFHAFLSRARVPFIGKSYTWDRIQRWDENLIAQEVQEAQEAKESVE